MPINGALVLEGGGMRGAFTAGVLDFFLDRDIVFGKVYGVSIGACHACSYLSLQRGRAFKVVADYINDPRYMSRSNLLLHGDLFPPRFVYHTIPDELEPYDYDAFAAYEGEFYAVVTDCRTGKPAYLPVKELHRDIDAVRASASLPGLSRIVRYAGGDYLDGGVSDSIPVKKAIDDGAKRVVAVLTRQDGYVKRPSELYRIVRLMYPNHPALGDAVKNRHLMYAETQKYIAEKEAAGEIFIIRPPEAPNISRLERNRGKLEELYKKGYETARERFGDMQQYLERTDSE